MRAGRKFVLGWCLVLMSEPLWMNCWAQEKQDATSAIPSSANAESSSAVAQETQSPSIPSDVNDTDNAMGLQFIRNLASDQRAIWTSPFHLHWDDATWLLPLGEVTAGFLATDRATARAISNNPTTLNHYRSFSNYGVGSLIAAGGGMYVWGRMTHDEHKRETGVLAAEAVIDSLGVSEALDYATQRERPYQDSGAGLFWHGGGSFPSDHAVMAWSAASVIAHEYPGPLTDFLAYGMAAAVTASRVMGKEHYPSDVVIGSAIGWLVGREVYRRHHDPDLGGGGWENLSGNDDTEEHRDPQKMGSPFVPLDSWVYPALDRLAALGYVSTLFEGMKPWTRIECAHLTEEAGERIAQQADDRTEAAALQARLEQEFAYEFALLEGTQQNLISNVESVYARAVSISGPPLTDGYHFGQTIAYDFGRPFERGLNGQAGGAFSASAGPVTLYVRAEYQHAPAAPPLSPAEISVINYRDGFTNATDAPMAEVDQPQLLDAYLAVNLDNWEISLGRQSLDWGPGAASMIWNNNIEPMNMARIVNPEPFTMPGFWRFLGPVRFDQFFGRMEGHYYNRRPFLLGQKITFKPLASLELGFARTLEIGGNGPAATPLTASQFFYGFFGRVYPGTNSVPGHNESEFDWTFYVPRVRNYLVFYGDMIAADDPVPWFNPPKNPFRPGIYLTRFPKIPKLDLHVEAADTESPGFNNPFLTSLEGGPANHGDLNYWNGGYLDGETYNGFLIGNTVGRDGRAIQAWTNYWLSPRDTLQFSYKHSTVSSDFMTGGGAWQDYRIENDLYAASGFYLRASFQYEHISHYPLLFPNGPQNNFSASLELGFLNRPGANAHSRVSQP